MRTNDLLVAIPHSTSHICSTFVANLIATKYEMCRTSTQRIRTSANVECHLLLHYFNYLGTDIAKMTPVQKHLRGLESLSRATLTTLPYLAGRASPPVQVRARSSGPAAHAIPPVQPEPSHLLPPSFSHVKKPKIAFFHSRNPRLAVMGA